MAISYQAGGILVSGGLNLKEYMTLLLNKKYEVDGGALVEPPTYKFHDAYITICDDAGKVIHFDKNIGDVWSGVAEYQAIKWVLDNCKRPCIISSDCLTAISWVRKGAKTKLHKLPKLDLTNVELIYEHNNKADQWNARNHSLKYDKQYYIDRALKKLI